MRRLRSASPGTIAGILVFPPRSAASREVSRKSLSGLAPLWQEKHRLPRIGAISAAKSTRRAERALSRGALAGSKATSRHAFPSILRRRPTFRRSAPPRRRRSRPPAAPRGRLRSSARRARPRPRSQPKGRRRRRGRGQSQRSVGPCGAPQSSECPAVSESASPRRAATHAAAAPIANIPNPNFPGPGSRAPRLSHSAAHAPSRSAIGKCTARGGVFRRKARFARACGARHRGYRAAAPRRRAPAPPPLRRAATPPRADSKYRGRTRGSSGRSRRRRRAPRSGSPSASNRAARRRAPSRRPAPRCRKPSRPVHILVVGIGQHPLIDAKSPGSRAQKRFEPTASTTRATAGFLAQRSLGS